MDDRGSIVEQAILNVSPGLKSAYEAALAEALPLIAATPGFRKIEVRPSHETPGRYLLLVWWDSVDAHEVGFRGSARYEKWRALLHRFYQPFPEVEHFLAPIAHA